MTETILDNWSVAGHGDHWHLQGFSRSRGSDVWTSRIVSAAGRVVSTKSGSRYTLGTMDPDFFLYLVGAGLVLFEDDPVGVYLDGSAANILRSAPDHTPKENRMADTDIEDSKPFKKSLPVEMTDEEKAKKGKQAGKLKKKIAKTKAEMKAATSGFRDSIKEDQAKLDSLLDDCEAGTEQRDVECVHRTDWKRKKVDTVRTDTNEVIESRTLSSEEHQARLKLVEPDVKDVEAPDPTKVVQMPKRGKKKDA